MSPSVSKPKVYRLRGCPAHLDMLGATKLLSQTLGDIGSDDIQIQSLATDLSPWARPPTKVATLVFRKLPALIEARNDNDEWRVPVIALEKPLLLDTHFLGMTPLNDVEGEKHEFDCIAISGLASHPFGSWQPKGRPDKSFMWIRDELPRHMSNTRAVIYGYDTTLQRSNSFQSIRDLAISFISHIKASGWAMQSAKPLVFLAHSLGGIVLKEAFAILASSREQGLHVLNLFRGGVFFGVPSQGMATSHLLAMVKGQVNEQLICDLEEGSGYLQSLDDQFSGLAVRSMHLYWAYETKTSPTVTRSADGSFARAGPEEILVSKESATRNLYGSRSAAVFPINENHSEMVKFQEDDHNFHVVMNLLKELCSDGKPISVDDTRVPDTRNLMSESADQYNTSRQTTHQTREWKLEELMKSLQIPGQNDRFDTIYKNFEHTFQWIFDAEKTPLQEWLKNGTGCFWVHGKPGSGKSTLMKFILKNRRTRELLHRFASETTQIWACFFFHDRGTLLQKSFEGLLRSVLYQIIEKTKETGTDLTELLAPLLKKRSQLKQSQANIWTIDQLEIGICLLFQQTRLDLEIFLLLDALDEYDGEPEFICEILKGLMDMTSNSRTKLKILFSSRPWEAFKQGFRSTPSIQLQDYTKDDIRNYCWGTINSKGDEISSKLGLVIPEEVIRRADGVFLWVKLVLSELVNEAAQGVNPDELENILSSTPSDLREYYIRTVQRIPESFRKDAWVILSVVSVENGLEYIPEVLAALECSRHSTYEKCCESIAMLKKRLWLDFKTCDASKLPSLSRKKGFYNVSIRLLRIVMHDQTYDESSKLLAMTGNLVELIGHGKVQLAHQTVKEFVYSQEFKQSILGHGARQVQENAYTYMAKYYLAQNVWHQSMTWLLQHEITTGRSMKYFLDSIPKEWPMSINLWTFAMDCNLQLYLMETINGNLDVLRETQQTLLWKTPCHVLQTMGTIPHWHSEPQGLPPPSDLFRAHTNLLRLLFESGYTIQQDPLAFKSVMTEVMLCQVSLSGFLPNARLKIADWFRYIKWITQVHQIRIRKSRMPRVYLISCEYSSHWLVTALESKAAILIANGYDYNLRRLVPIQVIGGHLSTLLRRNRPQYLKPIHIAKTVTLTSCLLEHEAEVNEPDTSGNTPLDHVLVFFMGTKNKDEWVRDISQTATLLIENGGITKTTTRATWEKCMGNLEQCNVDIAPFRSCFDRIEFDEDDEPKRNRKKLFGSSSRLERGVVASSSGA